MRLSNEDHMQISDLAEKLGITTRTIRLYEKMGLVEPPLRTDGRVRYYEKADVTRFKFVLKLKELGLSLEEMKDLVEIYNSGEKIPGRIMPRLIELLDTHLKSIKEKVSTLQSLEKDITVYRQRIVDEYKLFTTPQGQAAGAKATRKPAADGAPESPRTSRRKAATTKS